MVSIDYDNINMMEVEETLKDGKAPCEKLILYSWNVMWHDEVVTKV